MLQKIKNLLFNSDNKINKMLFATIGGALILMFIGYFNSNIILEHINRHKDLDL